MEADAATYDRVGVVIYATLALLAAFLLGEGQARGATDLASAAGICLGVVGLMLYLELP